MTDPSVADRESLRPESSAVSSLPAERRLTVQDLRRVERERRTAQHSMEEAQQLPALAAVPQPSVVVGPVAGESRRRWLWQRLVMVLQDDMVVCSQEDGVEAVVVLEVFERVTGQPFTDSGGASGEGVGHGAGKRCTGGDLGLPNDAVSAAGAGDLKSEATGAGGCS